MEQKASVRAIALLSLLVMGLFVLALATSFNNSITGAAIGVQPIEKFIVEEMPFVEENTTIPEVPNNDSEVVEINESIEIIVNEKIEEVIVSEINGIEEVIEPIQANDITFYNNLGEEIETDLDGEVYYLDSIIDTITFNGNA